MSYRTDALKAYGTACEFIGCKWAASACDVHHIDYNEQQAMESALRKVFQTGTYDEQVSLSRRAEAMGYGQYNPQTRQLDKRDAVDNLSVLCPNHHRYVHEVDLGKRILAYLPPRKA